ncbi:MAG: Gfo/Idh/MocA family oxidoreductase [Victivallaceae bacterium]|nr:Gfo/Idh/MocA family oxidoreductase [Victivallaceae bacterium]
MVKIKYALIGFGGIAENRIAKEGFACDTARFSALEKAELVGAADLNPARREAAEALGLKWYASADEIFAAPEIDAVFVATNNLTHAGIAEAAMRAGKHVIVEKPIATTVEDAEKLVAAARETGKSLAVDHMMVYNSYNELAKKTVASGKLGNVSDSCFHMEFCYGSTPEEAATWRCSSLAEMGGPIGDVASHCMYMAEFMSDSRIVSLACVYLPKTMDIKAENGAYIKFNLADGLSGSAKVAFSEARSGLGGTVSNLGYEIYGSAAVLRGYATLFQLSGYEDEPVKIRLELDSFTAQESLKPAEIKNIYQEVINHHAESILSGKPLLGGDGVHNLKLCYAAHKSAQNNGALIEVK